MSPGDLKQSILDARKLFGQAHRVEEFEEVVARHAEGSTDISDLTDGHLAACRRELLKLAKELGITGNGGKPGSRAPGPAKTGRAGGQARRPAAEAPARASGPPPPKEDDLPF